MKTMKIAKGSGGFRVVCCPSPKRKRMLQNEIPRLQHIVNKLCDLEVVHGFAEMRSPVTNAKKHIGYRFTLSMDLKDFFDTVTIARHFSRFNEAYIKFPENKRLFHNGVARQGLPTSPILANIAAAPMDRELKNLYGAVYSRYADDLTFSFNAPHLEGMLIPQVVAIARKHGFIVNDAKTTLQDAQKGRRHVTGVGVDETAIYPTRAAKRKLRAARHNLKNDLCKAFPAKQWMRYKKTCEYHKRTPLCKMKWLRRWLRQKVRGLSEWCKLSPPRHGRRSAERIEALGLDCVAEIGRLAERHV